MLRHNLMTLIIRSVNQKHRSTLLTPHNTAHVRRQSLHMCVCLCLFLRLRRTLPRTSYDVVFSLNEWVGGHQQQQQQHRPVATTLQSDHHIHRPKTSHHLPLPPLPERCSAPLSCWCSRRSTLWELYQAAVDVVVCVTHIHAFKSASGWPAGVGWRDVGCWLLCTRTLARQLRFTTLQLVCTTISTFTYRWEILDKS